MKQNNTLEFSPPQKKGVLMIPPAVYDKKGKPLERLSNHTIVYPATPEYLLNHIKKATNKNYPVVSARLTMNWDDPIQSKFTPSNRNPFNHNGVYMYDVPTHKTPNVVYYICAIDNYVETGMHSTHAVCATAVRGVNGKHRIFFFNPWGMYSAGRVARNHLDYIKELHNILKRHAKTPRQEKFDAMRADKNISRARSNVNAGEAQDLKRKLSENTLIYNITDNLRKAYKFDGVFDETYMYNGVNLQERDKDGICISYAALFLVKAPMSLFTSVIKNNSKINDFGKTFLSYKHEELLKTFYLSRTSKPITAITSGREAPTGVRHIGIKRGYNNTGVSSNKSAKRQRTDGIEHRVFFTPIGMYRVFEQVPPSLENAESMFSIKTQGAVVREIANVTTHLVLNKKTSRYVMVRTFESGRMYESGRFNNGQPIAENMSAVQSTSSNETIEILASAMIKLQCGARPKPQTLTLNQGPLPQTTRKNVGGVRPQRT